MDQLSPRNPAGRLASGKRRGPRRRAVGGDRQLILQSALTLGGPWVDSAVPALGCTATPADNPQPIRRRGPKPCRSAIVLCEAILPDGDWKSEQARSGVAPLVKARFPCGDWRRCRDRRIASDVRNGLKLERRWKPRRKRSTMPGPDEDQLSGADPTRRCGAWHAQRRNR